MDTKTRGIAKYKSQLRAAISNIRKLESVHFGAVDSLHGNDIQTLMLQTSTLLASLENPPIAKISRIVEKRKRKHRNAKLRRKLIRRQINQIKLTQTNTVNAPAAKSIVLKEPNKGTNNKHIELPNSSQKHHQQLRSYRDSNRFLRTFELLELLHMARVGDAESTQVFSEKLSKLRSIWNLIRSENLPEKTTAQRDISNQWRTVLFGVQEQSFYKQQRNFNNLISVRRKWDSYITQEPNIDSSIPQGWVLPRVNADPRWACYRTQ